MLLQGICYSAYFPQTSSEMSFISFILAHCSSSVSLLPISQEANPHCGLRYSLSRGTIFAASRIRLIIDCLSSSFRWGRCRLSSQPRRGREVPARAMNSRPSAHNVLPQLNWIWAGKCRIQQTAVFMKAAVRHLWGMKLLYDKLLYLWGQVSYNVLICGMYP